VRDHPKEGIMERHEGIIKSWEAETLRELEAQELAEKVAREVVRLLDEQNHNNITTNKDK
jgi:hypothetical protein